MSESSIRSIELDAPLSSIPYGEQWLGVWAMHEQHFEQQLSLVQNMSIKVHLDTQAAAKQVDAGGSKLQLQVSDQGIAMITLTGPLQKQRASLSRNTSTVEARQLVRAAVNDADVKGIMLFIDSPGGTVAGTGELAAEVARANTKKPVYAYIEDLGASAAYWIASQAGKVFVNASGMVGSIGTYSVVYDWSAAAAKDGVKVHVIKAGDLKGTGIPGTEITAAQLADLQRMVTQLNDQFVAGVAAGRKLTPEQARALADGRVHVGQAAMDLKLVDGVASAEDVVAELITVSSASTKTRKTSMSTQTEAPKAATLAELKAAFPKATADWREAQQLANATLEQASKNYIAFQEEQLEAANKRANEAEKKVTEKQEATDLKSKKPGAEALKSGKAETKAEFEGDAVAEYSAKVREVMDATKCDRVKASTKVAKSNPDLHAAYLLATNPSAKAQRLIREKLE